jgi:hypothetical protein
MTLLTIAQRVADEVGLPRPAGVAGSTDQLARQMFALANTTLEELGKRNWPELVETFTFPTVVNQAAYSGPTDYARFATDAAFVTSMYYSLRGSLSANEWQRRLNGLPSIAGRYRYRVFGSPPQINIVPAPQKVESVTFEYLSSNLAVNASNVPIPLYSVDTDTSIMPEELVRKGLKWRIKHAKGLDYSEDYNAYERDAAQLFAQKLNLGSTPVAQRYLYGDLEELGAFYVPETGFGS